MDVERSFWVKCDYNEEIYYHCNYENEIYQPIDVFFEKGFSTLEWW